MKMLFFLVKGEMQAVEKLEIGFVGRGNNKITSIHAEKCLSPLQ
jgi:hypothetical protein